MLAPSTLISAEEAGGVEALATSIAFIKLLQI